MKSNDLRKELVLNKNTRYVFGKVLSIDELLYLPKLTKKSFIIVNNQPQYLKGEHWLAIFIPSDQSQPIELFDSFGNAPTFYNEILVNFLMLQRNKYSYNTLQIQSPKNDMCGLFCIYFISMRCIDIPFNIIMQVFDENNLKKNEKIIMNYFSSHNL